ATCTLARLADWPLGQSAYAPAATLARQCCHALLGSFKVHNVATVGGNICLSLPAGPMTSLTSALDGVLLLCDPGGGRRNVPVTDSGPGAGRNALRPGDPLPHVWLPPEPLLAKTAFRQLSLSPVGRSAVLVIARRDRDGQTVVTVTASTPRPVQLRF